MEGIISKKNWWIVVTAGAVLALALMWVAQYWLTSYAQVFNIAALVILGGAFYWAYALDKERLWWAQIVALSCLTVIVTIVVAYITPKDASGSSPYGVITLGLGAALIGYLLKRPGAKFVLYAVAAIILLVGILMLPLALVWKLVLLAVELAVLGYLAWGAVRKMK